jgi:hypothetical protein
MTTKSKPPKSVALILVKLQGTSSFCKPANATCQRANGSWQRSLCRHLFWQTTQESLGLCGVEYRNGASRQTRLEARRDARSAAVKAKIAKGEPPFAADTKELMLFEMLKAGCTGDELKAKFGLKPGQVGNRAQQIATLTGGDLVKTARKGAVTLRL